MAPADVTERLAFLFPNLHGPGCTPPEPPDTEDHGELRRLVSADLALPSAANVLEGRALSTFVDLRAYFARLVLADAAGAWQTVERLLDGGHDRDDVLELVNGVMSDHVLDPMTSGSEIDAEAVHDALERLGRWDPLDDELEQLPWMIGDWRSSGLVADDEIGGIVREVIHPEVLHVIGDGVRTIEEVAAPFADRLRLSVDDAVAVVGMYLAWLTNGVVVTPRGNVARREPLLDGVRFRHVISQAEASVERLEVGTDLSVVLDDIDAVRLPDGSPLESTFRTAVDGPESRQGHVHVVAGPPGWLGGVAAGDEVAISRIGDQVTVERLEPTGPRPEVIAALAAAQVDLRLPTDVFQAFDVASADSGGLGPDLGAPLSELLALAGWSIRDEELGAADHDWDGAHAERAQRGRASVLDAAGVDPALAGQVERLVEELFGVGNWFHSTDVRRVPDERVAGVSRLLGREGVAGAAWTLGVGPDPDPSVADEVLDLAQGLLDRCSAAHAKGPARLALLTAGKLDRVDLLPDLLNRAVVDETADPGLCAVAADVAIDRGDIPAARRHQQRGWLPPGELLRRTDQPEGSFSAGRNDPCPCGSGQKYKRCHGDARPRNPTDDERADLVAIRLDQHAHRRLHFTHRLAKRARLVEDDQWWVDGGELAQPFLRAVTWFAGGVLEDHLASRGALLSEPDRALEKSWAGARPVVGAGGAVGQIELADGRILPTGSGIVGSFVLPLGSSVGWEVPIGGQATFVFGAPLGVDVAKAADLFADAAEPDDIADALGTAWRRSPSVC